MRTKLSHGQILYVEEFENKNDFENFKWHLSIKNENNMIVLHINTSDLKQQESTL